MYKKLLQEINSIKHISTHEHLGAIHPYGFLDVKPGGSKIDHVKGNVLKRAPEYTDFLRAPYMGWLFRGVSANLEDCQNEHKNQESFYKEISGNGLYQALDIGLEKLYGINIKDIRENPKTIEQLNEILKKKYKKGFFGQSEKVFEAVNVSKVLKPVHVNYLYDKPMNDIEYKKEKELYLPILRVDDLFGSRDQNGMLTWDYLHRHIGFEVKNINDIDSMIEIIMQKVVDHKLCSIKQAQAYSRTLAFDDISKDEAQVYYDKMLNGDTKAYLPVQDYIMHAICRYANDIKIPYQIHTAMTNLPISNPVNLTNLFTIYGDVKFVLLHGFPYINETAFLASRYDNVYIDIAWLGLQSRDILFDALMKYIGFVPNNKICISGDATSLEEFCGITIINREVAAKVLNEKIKRGSLNKTQSIKIAKKIFKKNAKMIYKI